MAIFEEPDAIGREVECVACASPPMLEQLELCPPGQHQQLGRERRGATWPAVETSWSGRQGFWRGRTPLLFGTRGGVGPLIIALDTAILIAFRKQLEVIEDGAGLVIGPQWSDRCDDGLVLRDLIQLWWWRDVRFWTSEIHLGDARKPLSAERRAAREAAVEQLGQDFFERGGFETIHHEGAEIVDRPCALHAALRAQHRVPRREEMGRKEPSGKMDRKLLRAAQEDGCHVFLTEDKGILRCHSDSLAAEVAILRPAELIEALEESGELEDTLGPMDAPFPDIAAISRLYGAFAPA
jgi:hypothetical protein